MATWLCGLDQGWDLEMGGESQRLTFPQYYFHSLNQEPFQELFLTHVPNKSSGTFEIR